MSPVITHALVLHLYQPPGNLDRLLQTDENELRRILLCYERIARHAHKYADVARLHVAFATPLLLQLSAPTFIDKCRHLVDLPAILEAFRSAPNIEFLGSGYQHAPLPLIPHADWEEQLRGERHIAEEVLGCVPRGYWTPHAMFSLDMLPLLHALDYEYLVLPHSLLVDQDEAPVDPYRTYLLRQGDVEITVAPCDEGFSHAQEHGLGASWLADELRNGVARSPHSDAPYLMTSCSDGENGEWFRRLDEEQGFFGHFFSPYMEFCQTGEFPVRPESLAHHVHTHPAHQAVRLSRQTPQLPPTLKPVLARLNALSASCRDALKPGAPLKADITRDALRQAHELILQAQGSGYLMTGDHAALVELLDRVEALLRGTQAKPSAKPVPSTFAKPADHPSTPAWTIVKSPAPDALEVATTDIVAENKPTTKASTDSAFPLPSEAAGLTPSGAPATASTPQTDNPEPGAKLPSQGIAPVAPDKPALAGSPARKNTSAKSGKASRSKKGQNKRSTVARKTRRPGRKSHR